MRKEELDENIYKVLKGAEENGIIGFGARIMAYNNELVRKLQNEEYSDENIAIIKTRFDVNEFISDYIEKNIFRGDKDGI